MSLDKKAIGYNVKALRKNLALSGEKFGRKVGITKSALSQIEAGSIAPSLELLNRIVVEFQTTFEHLIGAMAPETNAQSEKNDTEQNITLVAAAHAGNDSGEIHQTFAKNAPKFSLPGLNKGNYKAFEVHGYSMLAEPGIGFHPGDIVVTQFSEKPSNLKDGHIYVIVTSGDDHDEVLLKRCWYIRDKQGHSMIRCDSDNKDPQFPPMYLPLDKVKEMWEFTRRITAVDSDVSGVTNRLNQFEERLLLLEQAIHTKSAQ